MSKTRRHFTAEQKAEIVRRHVAGKVSVGRQNQPVIGR